MQLQSRWRHGKTVSHNNNSVLCRSILFHAIPGHIILFHYILQYNVAYNSIQNITLHYRTEHAMSKISLSLITLSLSVCLSVCLLSMLLFLRLCVYSVELTTYHHYLVSYNLFSLCLLLSVFVVPKARLLRVDRHMCAQLCLLWCPFKSNPSGRLMANRASGAAWRRRQRRLRS